MEYEKKLETLPEVLVPPTEVGNVEDYQGSGKWSLNPFKNFHLQVEHQPSSFAPNSKWSNKGTYSQFLYFGFLWFLMLTLRQILILFCQVTELGGHTIMSHTGHPMPLSSPSGKWPLHSLQVV